MKLKTLPHKIFLVILISVFLIYANLDKVLAALPYNEHEVVELRTETSKTFQTGIKSFRYEESGVKIHYKDSSGKYQDIDSNIIANNDSKYIYRNAKNDFTFFAGKDLHSGVKYVKNNQICEFSLDSIANIDLRNSSAKSVGNKIVYENIYDKTNLEFTILPNGVKTEVVTDNNSLLSKNLKFSLPNCNINFTTPTITDDTKQLELSETYIREDNKQKLVIVNNKESDFKNHQGKVKIDPSILNDLPTVDIFTSQNLRNGDLRRFLAVGSFYDTTTSIALGRSESYLKFGLNLDPSAMIESAELSMRRYANGGGSFQAKTARLTSEIPGNIGSGFGMFLPKAEVYSTQTIDSGDNDFHDYRWDLTTLVKSWKNGTYPNYGVAVYSDNAAAYAGAAFCSSRSDTYCFATYAPKLIINYTINHPPFKPYLDLVNSKFNDGANFYYGGDCDDNLNNCRAGKAATLKISGVGDSDPYPYNLFGTNYELLRNGSIINTSNLIGGSGDLNLNSINILDGNYSIRARSVDNAGSWSEYSNTANLVVDTTPPTVPNLALSEFTKGATDELIPQVTLKFDPSTDNISTEIKYIAEYSLTPDFAVKYSTNPVQGVLDSGKITIGISKNGADGVASTADDINTNGKYYFRVKALDKLNNEPVHNFLFHV